MKKNSKKTNVIKEEHIEINGKVTDCLPGAKFKVLIENTNREALCTLSGKLRMNNIQIVEGDSVEVKLSPYDLSSGIITWRNK